MHILRHPLIFGGAGWCEGKFDNGPDGEEAGKVLNMELSEMTATHLLQHLVGFVVDDLVFSVV